MMALEEESNIQDFSLNDLYEKLVRGITRNDISILINQIIKLDNKSVIEDLCVIAFHVRDPRAGKGERQIFYDIISVLTEYDIKLVKNLMKLIPDYGCWKDLIKISQSSTALHEDALEIFNKQLKIDSKNTKNNKGNISYAAKWAPREKKIKESDNADKKFMSKFAEDLAKKMFPNKNKEYYMMNYRKFITPINKKIETIETYMCSGNWSKIDPENVPKRAEINYCDAFMNLDLKDKDKLRRPDDEDRMECREHFIGIRRIFEARDTVGLSSAQVLLKPDEKNSSNEENIIINKYKIIHPNKVVSMASSNKNKDINDMWESIVKKNKKGFNSTIFIPNLSDSMKNGKYKDINYWISMSISILGAEMQESIFKNKIMTYDCKWQILPEGDIHDKIQTLEITQNETVDFEEIMNILLNTLISEKVVQGNEPKNIVIISNINYDKVYVSKNRKYYIWNYDNKESILDDNIENNIFNKRCFPYASYENEKKRMKSTDNFINNYEFINQAFKFRGYKMPHIFVWNLESTKSAPKELHQGVTQISGWSPLYFEYLQKNGFNSNLSEMDMLNIEIRNPRYKEVRKCILETISIKNN
jgi:hypothetical protein